MFLMSLCLVIKTTVVLIIIFLSIRQRYVMNFEVFKDIVSLTIVSSHIHNFTDRRSVILIFFVNLLMSHFRHVRIKEKKMKINRYLELA